MLFNADGTKQAQDFIFYRKLKKAEVKRSSN